MLITSKTILLRCIGGNHLLACMASVKSDYLETPIVQRSIVVSMLLNPLSNKATCWAKIKSAHRIYTEVSHRSDTVSLVTIEALLIDWSKYYRSVTKHFTSTIAITSLNIDVVRFVGADSRKNFWSISTLRLGTAKAGDDNQTGRHRIRGKI